MDFFQAQERARRQSGLLVFYFVLAVVGIIVAIYVPVAIALAAEGDGARAGRAWWANYEVLALCVVGVGAVVGLGSLWKSIQLGKGGGQVALDLGGRQLTPDTTDFHERRLMNVVEEMALAAGMPVPDVYLLDEERGINAFAAGRTPGDAVIGVTRGCLETLTREELQGVIAHEYSHIQNGDMRLNLRLIGVLHGILLLTLVGRVLMRSAAFRSSGNRNGGGALAIVLLGLWLVLVGFIGIFFGRLIKAAVSRQREYLADASAVQFTRSPGGISGALKRIGAAVAGSRLDNPKAEEASHLFFANGMASWLSTHPPLERRILAIEPSWDGSYPEVRAPSVGGGAGAQRDLDGDEGEEGDEGEWEMVGEGEGELGMGMGMAVEGALLGSMEGVGAAHLALAARMHRGLPEGMLELAHGAAGSQALVLALLVGKAPENWEAELEELGGVLPGDVIELVPICHGKLAGLGSQEKLAVVDLCLPALRGLGMESYEHFVWAMKRLIARDGVVDLFEFTLEQVVQRHLDVAYRKVPPPLPRIKKLGAALEAGSELLWSLALVGAGSEEAAMEAYLEGARVLVEIEPGLEVPPAGEVGAGVSLERISEAFEVWGQAVPLLKRQLLLACGRVVMKDGVIEDGEAELLRAIADAIGTPIPPLVVGPPPLGGGGGQAGAVVSV